MNSRIAFFISPHDFGHAARAASVMEALNSMDSSIQFDIFTTIPAWFFKGNLGNSFQYHYLQTDPGLSQKTPFQENYANTLKGLDKLFPSGSCQRVRCGNRQNGADQIAQFVLDLL